MSNIEREKCLRKVPICNTDFLQNVFNRKYDYKNLKLKKFVKRIKKRILPNCGSLRKIKVTADVIIITVIREENYTLL